MSQMDLMQQSMESKQNIQFQPKMLNASQRSSIFMKRKSNAAQYLSPEKNYIQKLLMKTRTGKNLEVCENDDSDLEKRFDIDFNQKQSLDERREQLRIIEKIREKLSKPDNKDDSFFMVVEKNPLEKIDDMEGRCLSLRKTIMTIKT